MCCKRVIIISLSTSFFSILQKVLYCDVPFHTIKEEFFASFPGLLHIRLGIFMYLCYCINLQESRWEHTPHAVKVSSSIQIQELSLGKCNSWKTLISFQDLQHVSFSIESSAMLSKKKKLCKSPLPLFLLFQPFHNLFLSSHQISWFSPTFPKKSKWSKPLP